MKTKHHVTVGRKSPGNPVCRTIRFGAHIQAIICYPKSRRSNRSNTRGKGRVISLRFDPNQYTLAQAKSWAKKKGYNVIKTAAAGTTASRKPAKKKARTRTNKKTKARSAQTRAGKAAPVCKIRGCKTRIRKKKGPGRPPTKCAKHRRITAKRKSRRTRTRKNPCGKKHKHKPKRKTKRRRNPPKKPTRRKRPKRKRPLTNAQKSAIRRRKAENYRELKEKADAMDMTVEEYKKHRASVKRKKYARSAKGKRAQARARARRKKTGSRKRKRK